MSEDDDQHLAGKSSHEHACDYDDGPLVAPHLAYLFQVVVNVRLTHS